MALDGTTALYLKAERPHLEARGGVRVRVKVRVRARTI